MSLENKLKILNITEYNLIGNKDCKGSYDRKTRENLYWVIEKMRANHMDLSSLEYRLFKKFESATFGALEDKNKKVKFEIARYRLSSKVKRSIKLTASAFAVFILSGLIIYEFILDARAQQKVDVAYYAGLNKLGLVSKENLDQIRQNLAVTTTELAKSQKDILELNQMVERMIVNNKVTENLKYIIKQVYNDPRTHYVKRGRRTTLMFNNRIIGNYTQDPQLWYLLGIVGKGVIRVYYNNEEILEIEAIFGRTGEETPIGEYEVKNRAYKPTWYKKEKVNGKTRVRAIPFGHPDHEIGHWWVGLKKLGDPIPGSYGLHGVNGSRVNEFFKKNFDWRNGSAGCPNIQEWYLHFLAKMVPLKTRVNIVQKDKWDGSRDFVPPSAA